MNKNQLSQTSKKFFRTLSIIHIAMLAGQIVFLAVILNLNMTSGNVSTEGLSFPFSLVVPILTVACIIASNLIYRNRIKQSGTENEITSKMQYYYLGTIIKLALLEGPSLFSIIVFLMTGELYFLIFTLILIMTFIVSRPSRQKAINDLKLNITEAELVKNDNSIIYKIQSRY
jgi:hypothetical protein